MKTVITLIMLTFTLFSQPLTISAHPDFKPISYKNSPHTLNGVGPHLIEQIFQNTSVQVFSKYVGPWARVQSEAKAGRIDLIAGIEKNKELLKDFYFIQEPFMKNPFMLYTKTTKPFSFNSWQDLKTKRGLALLGDSYNQKFEAFLKRNAVDITYVKSIEQMFLMLSLGRADFIVYSKYKADSTIKKLKLEADIIHLKNPVYVGELYFAFSKKTYFNIVRYEDRIVEHIKAYKKSTFINELLKQHLH